MFGFVSFILGFLVHFIFKLIIALGAGFLTLMAVVFLINMFSKIRIVGEVERKPGGHWKVSLETKNKLWRKL